MSARIYTVDEARNLVTVQSYLDARSVLDAGRLGREEVLDLLTQVHDLAATVVHHAERADRAEAEIEQLRADLDLALIHAGNAQRWATGRVMRVTAQASAERERHARELEELRFQLDEMAAVLLAARAGDALSDDLCERARSRSASLTEARAVMERCADLARDVLADLGAPSGTMKEMGAWCRDHLVHVDAVSVMAAERADRAEAEIERLRAELRGDQAHIAAAARARERDEALAEVDRLRIDRDRYIQEAESLRAAASSAGDTAHANTSGAI